jgi:hypothetical protein
MEKFITRYSQTYILIGQLELILRARLIETLSQYSLEKGYTEWHEVLDSFKTYQKIDNRMYYAAGTRNRVCHFNFANSRNVKHEEANLRWLIRALGEKSVAIVEPSA